jgi:hypothetical protein
MIAMPASDVAAQASFSGTLTITPDAPAPIPVGPPGIDLTAEWITNRDETRFQWKVDGVSQGVNEVAAGEGLDGDETMNFQFLAADDYEVCFNVFHHTQADRNLEECVTVSVFEETCEWYDETAWSDGFDYPGANWALYTPYDGSELTVDLIAGQNMFAGTVTFSEPGPEVTVTIELESGWRFEDVDENVKIQDYADEPDSNPIPGQFEHKSKADGSTHQTDVPDNNYYGVHVDLERCVISD